jgi:hypothetical protein
MDAEVDMFPAVVGLLFEYLKMHGTTNPKYPYSVCQKHLAVLEI